MDKHPSSHQYRIDAEPINRIKVYSRNSVCKLSAIISVWPEVHSIKTGSLYIVSGRDLEYIACWEIIYYKILYYAEQSISSHSYCRCLLRYAPECISSTIFQWNSKTHVMWYCSVSHCDRKHHCRNHTVVTRVVLSLFVQRLCRHTTAKNDYKDY